MYDIEIKNLDKVLKEFENSPEKIDKDLQKSVKNIGATIVGIEKKEAPVGTGHLRRNIIFKYYPISVEIFPNTKYASYIESGTGLYGPRHDYIRPVSAKALAFKINGRWVFAKKTKGQKANKFVKRTADKAGPVANAIINKMLNNL